MQKIQQLVRKHPVKCAICGFIFITFPQWLSGTWALFCSVPLYQWLQSKGYTMVTFTHFSWNWISVPIGLGFLAYIAWETRKQRKVEAQSSLAGKPKRKTKEERLKESLDKIARRNFPERFGSDFEIEGIANDVKTYSPVTRNTCKIRVHNKSTDRQADNVELELIDYNDSPENKDVYRPVKPLILLPENDVTKTINPGRFLIFNLFDVHYNSVRIAGMTPSPITVKFQLPNNWLIFERNKNYLFKFRATARDCSPVIMEGNLNFVDDGAKCRFTLTPVIGLTDAEKKKRLLHDSIVKLDNRIRTLNGGKRYFDISGEDRKISIDLIQEIYNQVYDIIGADAAGHFSASKSTQKRLNRFGSVCEHDADWMQHLDFIDAHIDSLKMMVEKQM